jgi:hypothetical protein
MPSVGGCRCELCGQPARVSVLQAYRDGQPLKRSFCLACADGGSRRMALSIREEGPGLERDAARSRLGPALILVAAGLVVAVVSLVSDFAGVGTHAGFGWKQIAILIIGALMVMIGALLRIDVIGLLGTAAALLALGADLLGVSGSAGFGWKQTVGLAAGFMLIGLGAIIRRLRRKADPNAFDSRLPGAMIR